MKKINYTSHLRLRLNARRFPEDYPIKIYVDPEMRLYDNVEDRNVAIKRLKYNKKLRNIMIAYEEDSDHVNIITIHPISKDKIINRISSGRWIENE